ncbi:MULTISPECIES: TonB-dependent receptor [Rhodomicrobium]|uniref:TonB-dependent receptor n=1 Tax=Rhodomicrobium TaxID=1068 RepID=UPI000B4A8D2C|nr:MULTISPECIES: TonB-dependent receptor [Rhodomicrobium]
MKRSLYCDAAAYAAAGVAAFCLASEGRAQQSQPGAGQIPPVNIIQEQPKPKPKKSVAKKKPQAQTQPQPAPAPEPAPVEIAEEPVDAGPGADDNLVRMSPLAGSELPLEKVPNAVGRVTAEDVERSGAVTIEQALQLTVPGIILSDLQGSEFQTDVQYRGFVASPVNGSPQGLAVYQNGVRINEVFGDTVNWDMIPTVAINDISVVSGNPVFGLNAIGGAISVTMKDGFGFQGVESDTRIGSYGRIQESLQGGVQSGNVAAYIALEGINDDGFRDFSPSKVRRMYGDLGVKNRDSEFHLNFTGASNFFGVAAPSPVELLEQDWSKTFTTPQTTKNDMAMLSANGTVVVTPTLSVSGVAYLRRFRQKHVDGNVSDVEPCDDADFLCLEDEQLVDGGGNPIANPFDDGETIGSIDRTSVDAKSFGASVQATSKAPLFGHSNQFVVGVSGDHGKVTSTSDSELGSINLSNFVVSGLGIFPQGPEGIVPVGLNTTTDYLGVYVSNTFDVTSALAFTAGGRFNYANLDLQDQLGNNADLTAEHTYTRFNPMAGLTYKFSPQLSLYGSYSEANRAPTPAELACSDPEAPCLLENFLVSDPELEQVVSHTWEAGLRGNLGVPNSGGRIDWSLGVFHTLNTNDIINVASDIAGRGFFQNAGDTLRQGIEAGIAYRSPRLSLFANYAYINATFQDDLLLPSPSNPEADDNGDIQVRKGDHIPAIPAHRIKLGGEYALTEVWRIGADMVFSSDQFFVGDEGNDNAELASYAVFNLHTSYQLTKNVQIYGIVNNVFDNEYATYGTFFEAEDVGLTDPRTITPAQPLSAYAGLKVKF